MNAALRAKRNRRIIVLTRVALVAGLITAVKSGVHFLGWEFISVNPLFSALVASTVFLLGFLLNGVLSDYKESEKLPGEIASCLMLLARETRAVPIHNPKANVQESLLAIGDLSHAVLKWVKSDSPTEELLRVYDHAHDQVVLASCWLDASSLKGRLMNEMSYLLRSIHRIDVIRETDFVTMVYWLANLATIILCGGLIFSNGYPQQDSAFFLFVISFLLVFVLHLISDIDNPFGFSDPSSAEDVDLEVLEYTHQRIQELINSYALLNHNAPIKTLV
jgi:hypothetical protein